MVGAGSAKVVLSLDAWKEGHVAASETQLAVVAPPPGLKREAVSSRLRQTLVHPDKSGVLMRLRYSADGRSLFAGHCRSGVVQAWDTATGKQLTSIETGPRNGSVSAYFFLSADGRILYVDRSTTRVRSFMGKEKSHYHFDFSGGARSWDVATGKPLHDFQPAPGCGVSVMDLSPDGSTLLMFEGVSGDYETPRAKRLGTLWDARTGQRRGALPKNVSIWTAFSPDSKNLLAIAVNDKSEMAALLFLDSATGEVRRSLPIELPHHIAYECAISPDGKRLACHGTKSTGKTFWLKCWDVESGREIASLESEIRAGFGRRIVFSPDGRLLTAHNFLEGKQFLIDVAKQEIRKSVSVGVGRTLREAAFSPDGKWLAVIAQEMPMNQSPSMVKIENLSQPHILLIEAATGAIRETLVAPPGVALSLCFSPDGKTLASGGDGRVLLWDMTNPLGTRSAER